MRRAGTSRLCTDRLTLPCNRAPRFAPKPAPRSTEWSEIGLRHLPANSGHPSRVYPALHLAYRTAPALGRENQPLNDRNSGIAAPSLNRRGLTPPVRVSSNRAGVLRAADPMTHLCVKTEESPDARQ